MMRALNRPSLEDENDDESRSPPGTSGTRKIARALVDVPPDRPAADELLASERPTLPVPRFELFEGGVGGTGVYGSVLGGRVEDAGPPASEVPTVPVPAPDRAQEPRLADVDPPPTRPPPSFRDLGSFQRVPYLTRSKADIRGAALDPKQAFVLVLIDGHLDIEAILDATPLPLHDVLRILLELRSKGLIDLR